VVKFIRPIPIQKPTFDGRLCCLCFFLMSFFKGGTPDAGGGFADYSLKKSKV